MFLLEKERTLIARFEILYSQEGVTHGISTRLGGQSKGPFAGLNLGWDGDKPEAVLANRRRFFRALGLELEDAVMGQQVRLGRTGPWEPGGSGRGG